MQHARHDLKTILDPVVDFLEQYLVAIQCSLEVALVPLPLNGHAEDVRRSLQERDIVFAELTLGSAVDFQHAVRRTIALKNDVHRTSNPMLDK
jgi:hypothetical protein